VVAQVALSMLLLSTASLFVQHLSNLEHIDLGFHRDHLLLMQLDASAAKHSEESYRQLLARLEAVPGVRSATLSAIAPIAGVGSRAQVNVEGYQPKPDERRMLARNWVSPKYFETLSVPLLAGRDFSFQDRGRSRVAIVNQMMSRYYFGDRSPIGSHITFDGDDRQYEIVGVVGDTKYSDVRDAPHTVYFNAFQDWHGWSQFFLRTAAEPSSVIPDVRRTVLDSLKGISIMRVKTMAEQVDSSIVPERLSALLSASFGALASVLTAIGLYGLLAYMVARRVSEIGVRMALGATAGSVTRLVVADAMAMVCLGLAIGIPIALGGKTVAASLIRDLPVSGAIPIVFSAAALLACALLAVYGPARRAAQVDPMEALRHE
jgi:predicted permease